MRKFKIGLREESVGLGCDRAPSLAAAGSSYGLAAAARSSTEHHSKKAPQSDFLAQYFETTNKRHFNSELLHPKQKASCCEHLLGINHLQVRLLPHG
jgi:hypothetical protein